jgi:hypothetical protein
MNTAKIIDADRKSLQPYAWPGGYPIVYVATDGWREEDGTLTVNKWDGEHMCCAKCAVDTEQWPDLIILGQDCHMEGPAEVCEYCNAETASAYGDPEEDAV